MIPNTLSANRLCKIYWVILYVMFILIFDQNGSYLKPLLKYSVVVFLMFFSSLALTSQFKEHFSLRFCLSVACSFQSFLLMLFPRASPPWLSIHFSKLLWWLIEVNFLRDPSGGTDGLKPTITSVGRRPSPPSVTSFQSRPRSPLPTADTHALLGSNLGSLGPNGDLLFRLDSKHVSRLVRCPNND